MWESIIDSKLNFRQHIIHTSRKCSTLIHTPAKSAKVSWGLKHAVLKEPFCLSCCMGVWGTSMDRGYGKEMQQNHIQQSTTVHEY
jgi:hypothetical protein